MMRIVLLKRLTLVLFGVAMFSLLAVTSASAQQVQLQPSAIEQLQALAAEKASWTPVQRKLDSQLLFALNRERKNPIFDRLPDLRTSLRREEDGRVLVDVRAEVTAGLLAEITARGGEVVNVHPAFEAIRARLPLTELEALAAADEVRFIAPAGRMTTNKNNTSEGDVTHRADLSRSTLGVDGSGVQIGVISNGVDSLAARQASGDLPGGVTVLAGQGGSGDEGTAMLEIVFDLAPAADLFFATALGGEAQMAQNVLDLQAAGCDVIVDDVFYFAEAVFQDDLIADAVEQVAAAGVLYFSSAGNSGNLNDGTSGVYEGDFDGVLGPPALSTFTVQDFDGAGTNINTITVDSPSLFTLHWSDALGSSGNDYDLILLDGTGSTIFDVGANIQDGDDDPFEAIDSFAFDDTGLTLAVVQFSGADRFIHVNTNRGRLSIATDGQTSGHATTPSSFGVAAVDVATTGISPMPFTGGAGNPVELFSSDGPRQIFYEADGTPITPGDFLSTGGSVLAKPDLAAADGVTTDTPGFSTFFGTSAAAPHAAAIAALAQETANLTPNGFAQVLAASALDIEAAGPDRDSGDGILDAFAFVQTVRTPAASGCSVDVLGLEGVVNVGPQVFRACQKITAGAGTFDQVTFAAYNGGPGTVVLQNGFSSNELTVVTSP